MGRRRRNHALPPLDRPWLYAISNGSGWADFDALVQAARAGVDLIQVREKQLPADELLRFCRNLRAAVPSAHCRLLVNSRFDIALAAGLDGVHCRANGLPASRLRALAPPGFLIGQSCHSPTEVAAAAGADFCVFGPVFATPSKLSYGEPLGLPALRDAVAASHCPVLALGGITEATAPACLEQGAAGVAGIRLVSTLNRNQCARLRVCLSRRLS
ncbi:MAG: thiamine phosphate synthase [Terriglobales bacterium]